MPTSSISPAPAAPAEGAGAPKLLPTGNRSRLSGKRLRERKDSAVAQANKQRPSDHLFAHRPDLFDRGADVPREIGIDRRALGVNAKRSHDHRRGSRIALFPAI
jgi:hypothetical protein